MSREKPTTGKTKPATARRRKRHKLRVVRATKRRGARPEELPPIEPPAWAGPDDYFTPLHLHTDEFADIGYPRDSLVLLRNTAQIAPGSLGLVKDSDGKNYVGLVYQDGGGGIEVITFCDCCHEPLKFEPGEAEVKGEVVGLARPRPALRLVRSERGGAA